MKITQEPKIAAQIIKALDGHEGNITINLNMNATQVGNDGELNLPFCFDVEFEKFFDMLPKPRLKSLIGFCHQMALKKFDENIGMAASYLGVTSRTIYNYLKLPKTV